MFFVALTHVARSTLPFNLAVQEVSITCTSNTNINTAPMRYLLCLLPVRNMADIDGNSSHMLDDATVTTRA